MKKNNFLKRISYFLGLSYLAVTASSLSAHAETIPSLSQTQSDLVSETQPSEDMVELTLTDEEVLEFDFTAPETQTAIVPAPGTVATSTDVLFQTPETNAVPQENSNVEAEEAEVAQVFEPGRRTRSGSSYIGAGFNIGLGGDTALGDTSFAINGKIGLTNTLSVRPVAVIGDETAFIIPITYDFRLRQDDPFESRFAFAPYLGGGVAFTTGDNDNIGFALSGGIDVPISRQFVANAGLNVAFLDDDTELGLLLGVGYTFPGFR